MSVSRRRRLVIAAAVVLGAGLHAAAPTGHAWHWFHLAARAFQFLPILLAAAWFDGPTVTVTTAAVSVLFIVHVARGWSGQPMMQAEQLASIAGSWVLAWLSWQLFERERRSRARLDAAHRETLYALVASLEMRERYTAGHSLRVRDYSLLLADKAGVSDPAAREAIAHAAVLHDIGKIGVPDAILLKEDSLTEGEWGAMREHPAKGAAMIGELESLRGAKELILAHHERVDGKGYPRGLSGEDIPLGTRIITVADMFDALTTDRPYRKGCSYEEALKKMLDERGRQLDPDLTCAFASLRVEALARIAQEHGVSLRHEGSPGGRGG